MQHDNSIRGIPPFSESAVEIGTSREGLQPPEHHSVTRRLGFFEVSHLIFLPTLCSTMNTTSCLGLCGTYFDCNSLLFLSLAVEGVHVYIYVCICMRIFLIVKKDIFTQ